MDPELRMRFDYIDTGIEKLTNLCGEKFANLEQSMDSTGRKQSPQHTMAPGNNYKSIKLRVPSLGKEPSRFREETQGNFKAVNEKLDRLDDCAQETQNNSAYALHQLARMDDNVDEMEKNLDFLVAASKDNTQRLSRIETILAEIKTSLEAFISDTDRSLERLKNKVDYLAKNC